MRLRISVVCCFFPDRLTMAHHEGNDTQLCVLYRENTKWKEGEKVAQTRGPWWCLMPAGTRFPYSNEKPAHVSRELPSKKMPPASERLYNHPVIEPVHSSCCSWLRKPLSSMPARPERWLLTTVIDKETCSESIRALISGLQGSLVGKMLSMQARIPGFNPWNLLKDTKHNNICLQSQPWGGRDRKIPWDQLTSQPILCGGSRAV